MRKTILKVTLAVLAAGIGYYWIVKLTGLSQPCIILQTTGYQCHSCGATRMAMAMLRLDFKAAFGYNPAMFLLVILWLVMALLGIWGKPKFLQNTKFWFWMLIASAVGLGGFGILRNFC